MLKRPVLLLGASGLIGRGWREVLARLGVVHDAPPHQIMDLEDPVSLRSVSQGAWGTVINCAGVRDALAAQRDQERAMRVNALGVGELATACARGGAALVHYSSHAVFDGTSAAGVGVGHVRCPVTALGRAHARGEELIETSGAEWLIVRTSWVYAPWGENFLCQTARALRERPAVEFDAKVRCRPTSAEHLARATLRLVESRVTGIWHIADGGAPCTRAEMAAEIAGHLAGAGVVRGAASPTGSEGPSSVLDLSRTEGRLGPLSDWRLLLAHALRRLEDASAQA